MPRADEYHFRPVVREDLPLLAGWLELEHVRRWWGDPAEAAASIEDHIGDPSVAPFIVTLNGADFGYIQAADLAGEDDEALARQPAATVGIDQFIGPRELVGIGHGPAFIGLFCERLFAKGARRILVDPHPDNAVAIKAYAKAGFARLEEATTQYGRALLMALDHPENEKQ